MQHDVRDVGTAIKEIADEPKRDFETLFPSLGTIVERVAKATRQRTNPVYKPCGQCIGGMVYVDAEGNKCDAALSPDRTMAYCDCRRDYIAMKKGLQAVA